MKTYPTWVQSFEENFFAVICKKMEGEKKVKTIYDQLRVFFELLIVEIYYTILLYKTESYLDLK